MAYEAPAIVQGSGPGADGANVVALFVVDEDGNLVDIEYLCSTCAWSRSDETAGALPWPAYDWGDSDAHCRECRVLVNSTFRRRR